MAMEVASNNSYPVNSAHLLQPTKRKKENNKFKMFNKRHAKKSRGQSAALASSDPLQVQHLSMDMDSSKWKSEDSLNKTSFDSMLALTDSDTSSRHSLLAADNEYPKMSDEELAEVLVNPPASWPPPPSPLRHSIDLEEESPAPPSGPAMEHMVNVTLLSGHNLAIRDRTGSSDPYVKFKCPPFKYRSAVVSRNLNPEWNEHFSFKIQNLKSQLIVRVYDHDYGALDDFMGGQTLDLAPYGNNEVHYVDLGLVDRAAPKDEVLGHIRLCIKISPVSDKTTSVTPEPSPAKKTSPSSKSSYSKVWTDVLTVTLIEGRDLPALDKNGFSDPYCKFKLGNQKYKSSVMSKSLNPKWLEQFSMPMMDGFSILHVEVWDSDFPQNDDFIGNCSVDLTSLTRDVTHEFTLPLTGGHLLDVDGTLHFNLSITASRVKEEEPDFQLEDVHTSYGWSRSLQLDAIKERNIGHLNLKVCRVLDLPPCSCYVLVVLGNCCIRTQTTSKTSTPTWDKAFNFVVQDLHEELEMRVYKVGRSEHFLGMVRIPLHRVTPGPHSLMLKEKNCVSQSRGILCVETEFVYQPVRAMIRTIQPKDNSSLDMEVKFQRKVLMNNIKRGKALVNSVIAVMELLQSAFSWENKMLSAISFLFFIMVTVFGELWMVFLGLAALLAYQYTSIVIRNGHVWQNKPSSQVHLVTSNRKNSVQEEDGSDFSDMEEDKRTTIKEKYRLLQSILVLVQKVVGEVADMEEGVRNLLTWKVPFLSWMAIVVFLIAAILMYFIPVRYIILAWGTKKFTQKLIRPNHIDNNELLDFLSRCPSNRKLEQWRELPLVVYHKQTLLDIKAGRVNSNDRKKRN